MPNYRVTLTATRYLSAIVDVIADDEDEAAEKACTMAGDLDWSDDNGLEGVDALEVEEIAESSDVA